jgi:hypothetical protein
MIGNMLDGEFKLKRDHKKEVSQNLRGSFLGNPPLQGKKALSGWRQ